MFFALRKLTSIKLIKQFLITFIFLTLPTVASARCEIINFDDVEFEKLSPGVWEMHVSGVTPRINMEVNLREIDEPSSRRYAQFEIVGCYPGFIGIPIPGRFSASVRVNNQMAVRGIKLIGDTQVKRVRF